MTSFQDRYQSDRSMPGGTPASASRLDAPGKRTLTEGLTATSATAPIQRQRAPIQRQSDPQGSHPVPDGAFVAQYADYGKDTDLSRANDCGPACILMALRAMGAEPNLIAAMPKAYQPVNPLQEMKYIAFLAFKTDVSAVRSPGDLQKALVTVLQHLNIPVPDDPNKTFELFSTGAGSNAYVGNNKKAADAANAASPTAAATLGMQEGPAGQFIAQHCVDGSAVIVMGYAEGGPWGWGPDKDPDHRKGTDGKPQTIRDDGDHFVFVWRPDQTKDLYIVMDPAWSRPLPPKPLSDVIGFIYARDTRLNADGSSLINIMAVPYAQVAAKVPAVAGAGTGTGGTSGTTGGGGTGAAKAGGPALTQAKLGAAPAAPVEDAGGGALLPPDTRGKMEGLFGTDLSGVRTHEGGAAPSVGALAYTQGNDVHFAPGQFRPGTTEGDRLIGHELAHVVQQRDGRVSSPQHKGAVVEAAGLEAEADVFGERAVRGEATGGPLREARAPAHAGVQRQDDPAAIAEQLTGIATAIKQEVAPYLPTDTLAKTPPPANDTTQLKSDLDHNAQVVAQLSTGATDKRVVDAATAANDAIVGGYQAIAVQSADQMARDWAKPGADHDAMRRAFRNGSAGGGDDNYCGEFVKAAFVSAGLDDFINGPSSAHFRAIFNYTDNVYAFFHSGSDAPRVPGFIRPHNDPAQRWRPIASYHMERNSPRTFVETQAVKDAQAAGKLDTVMRAGDVVTMYYGTNANSDPNHADHTAMVRRVIGGNAFETIEGNAYVTDANGKTGPAYVPDATGKLVPNYAVGTNLWGTDPANTDTDRTFSNTEQKMHGRVFLVGRLSVVDFEAGHGYSLTDPTAGQDAPAATPATPATPAKPAASPTRTK